MPRHLLLVRHGLTDWNEQGRLLGRSDIPLNPRGTAQAAALAAALRPLAPQRLIVSPQRRARETAAAIAAACALTAEVETAIDEVWLGRWQGKTFAELHDDPDVHAYLRDPRHLCDAVEPLAALEARLSALAAQLRAAPERVVVVVSHGDPLRALLAVLLGLPAADLRKFDIQPGSLSAVRLGRKRAQLSAVNWRPGDLQALLQD